MRRLSHEQVLQREGAASELVQRPGAKLSTDTVPEELLESALSHLQVEARAARS